MKLVLISYPDFFKEETNLVSSLLERYEFTFHLRKPKAEKNDLINYLNKIPSHLHHKIAIHNEIEVFKQFALKGIHFSSMKRTMAKQFSGFVRTGTSCHSVKELNELNSCFHYVFLSPVYPSISKKGYLGNADLLSDMKKNFVKNKNMELYALGGIDASKINELKQFEFDGIAVLGSVWTDQPEAEKNEIESNLQEICTCLDFTTNCIDAEK